MFERYKEKERLLDLADRKVYLVEFKFETTLGEIVEYSRWARVDKYSDRLVTINEREFYDSALTIGKRTYNTKHIVNLDSKIVKEGYVKESVKKKLGGYGWSSITSWEFKTYYSEDQIEVE